MSIQNKIVGWDALREILEVGRPMTEKWMKLYKFPRPKKEALTGDWRRTIWWFTAEVEMWIQTHSDVLENGRRNSRRFKRK